MVSIMANVLLLHLDGDLPNIALMRIAAHHRTLGDALTLRRAESVEDVEPNLGDDFARVYASAIFKKTSPLVARLRAVRPDAIVGGTGVDIRLCLSDIGITTRAVDYSLYPDFAASLGFTQRGCRLRCEFCVVPEKEGSVVEEQSVAEIWRGNGHPRHIHLLDNDFFGQRRWRDRIEEIRAGGFRVCFTQGINARLISENIARAIASVDYRASDFKTRRIYAAWDNRDDEERLFEGLDRLRAAGVKPRHVLVYMLCGYWAGETHEDREHRRTRLRAWGALPYPMPFVRTPELIAYQRWVVGAYDKGPKAIPWAEWMRAKGQPRRLGDRTGAQIHLPIVGGNA
jgi:hypothetical protein